MTNSSKGITGPLLFTCKQLLQNRELQSSTDIKSCKSIDQSLCGHECHLSYLNRLITHFSENTAYISIYTRICGYNFNERFAQSWPHNRVYRASWHRQKIRLCDFYHIDYRNSFRPRWRCKSRRWLIAFNSAQLSRWIKINDMKLFENGTISKSSNSIRPSKIQRRGRSLCTLDSISMWIKCNSSTRPTLIAENKMLYTNTTFQPSKTTPVSYTHLTLPTILRV